MSKKIIVGALIAATMLPALAFAQSATSTDAQTQIQSLLSQIRALQEQLKALILSTASSTRSTIGNAPGQIGKAMCIQLARNLREGTSGDDVRSLQEMLREDKENGFTGNATGFFGPLTARAMAKFQTRMGIASSTDGAVGPLTRGFFQRRCGKGLDVHDDLRSKVAGTISTVASSSITVLERDGESRVVNVTASTTIHVLVTATSTPTAGTMTDLTVGKTVIATGTSNADGSMNALRIQVGVPHGPLKILKFDNRGRKHMEDD